MSNERVEIPHHVHDRHPFYVEPCNNVLVPAGPSGNGVQIGVAPHAPQLYIGDRDTARRFALAILELTDPPDLKAMHEGE